MSAFSGLEPADAWGYFETICSIPHPSGHEHALAVKIAELAKKRGLKVKIDSANNVRIDREPSPGCGDSPLVILQGHLDMVPKAKPGLDFDFTTRAIRPVVRGKRVYADGTTLGSDDGAGVATALAVILDPDLKCGPLAALFTTGEEVGLLGATALAPEMLRGDWLLNLDSGGEDSFCIGCAGGARLSFAFPENPVPAAGGVWTEVSVEGLRGGHSGTDIDKRRGNALIYLARFLAGKPGIAGIASFLGGDADNAIPSEARAAVLPREDFPEFEKRAEAFAEQLKKEFDSPAEFRIRVKRIPAPERMWGPALTKHFPEKVATVPDGVFQLAPELGIVKTSSNFAAVFREEPGVTKVRTSQRSLVDSERTGATEKLIRHFASCGGTHEISGVYPGWTPDPGSPLLKLASETWRELFGRTPRAEAIHAGVESGIFTGKNPSLRIVAMGVMDFDIHTPEESLDIESFRNFNKFIRALVEKASKTKQD